ncbi:hypothetical protein K2224_01395 [Streptomyces sp. BHT-5-2]|nr:hypothetical protein K2224_01395 [Streptomyces sp. BHT-5-2]
MASAIALVSVTVAVAACGVQKDERTDGGATSKRVEMNEHQAIERAEKIVHQAVDGMSPAPTLKPVGNTTGACLARDESGHDDRVQVTRMYRLTGVPGVDAKKLVRQARDAWVKLGYEFQSPDADGDWSDPFPRVHMRTVTDDFWMQALTGVVDRQKGEGLTTIKVTSPCFAPETSGNARATPSTVRSAHHDERAERQVLAHSSGIYNALRAPHAPEQDDQPRMVQDADGTWLHHAWSTAPLTEDETLRAMERAQEHLASAGWTVRHLKTRAGSSSVVARYAGDDSVAQIAPSSTGAVRVAVTVPAAAVLRADV